VRVASGRPPVVLVSREGDPATAIAVAVTTAGIAWGETPGDEPEAATALAGLVEARLRAKAIDVMVTPSWDGLRASSLATTEGDAVRIVEAVREAMSAPVTNADLAPARRKLTALGQRPLRDRALGRWARCVGQPHALPERAGSDYPDLDVQRLERWRAAGLGLGRVAIAVTGPPALSEAVASAVLRGPTWKPGTPIAPRAEGAETSVEVFEVAPEAHALQAPPVVYVTLDVATSSAAVTTAEALGDPRGPLAARLSSLDLPFRLREVTGAAHAQGGCVGVVLEALSTATSSWGSLSAAPNGLDARSASLGTSAELAPRVADAVALVHLEAGAHLTEAGALRDGRVLSRRSGDARESAERAAWWALVDQGTNLHATGGSVALGAPARRGATAHSSEKEAALEPSRDVLAAAIAKATAAWNKPVIEVRSRVEAGQGEAWILLASPCGTDAETDADAGLTALFTAATVEGAKTSSDVRLEPWVVPDGAGILVHGPALSGEGPAAHARRLADIAARSFAAEPITSPALARARADLLRRDTRSDGSALSVLASALAPQHPSWVIAWGSSELLARSSDASALLRAQSLRAGPLRVAVLANVDASQAEAAVRAADRWVTRRTGDARACGAPTGALPSKPGTYAAPPRPGSVPEAYLAFPFPPGDEAARAAAVVVAAALDGDGALLDKALGGGAVLARESSARVLGWPRAPALVVRIVALQASLDAAVMQARALIDRLHRGGLARADSDRAIAARARASLSTALDPRARVVATWRGEPIDATERRRVTAEDVRAFAQRHLTEDTMVVVASRPGRPPVSP
jgi:hypothetical protein